MNLLTVIILQHLISQNMCAPTYSWEMGNTNLKKKSLKVLIDITIHFQLILNLFSVREAIIVQFSNYFFHNTQHCLKFIR